MIDPNAPLELDNGVRVEMAFSAPEFIDVRVPEGEFVDRANLNPAGGYRWSYYRKTGIFAGGSADLYYVLRNYDDAKDWEYDV